MFSGTALGSSKKLLPGDDGYVGALYDRPSNSIGIKEPKQSNSSGSIQPNDVYYFWSYEPTTINVLVRPNNDPAASGTVVNYDFGYYLQNVLPNEWISSWGAEALKAGAVCVRGYGWYCVNYPKYPSVGAALDNTVNSQVFKPGTAVASTNSAISGTAGEVREVYSGAVQQPCFYKAGTYGTNRDSSSYDFYNNVYQNGTDYFADNGYSYSYMLDYYYPGTIAISGYGV